VSWVNGPWRFVARLTHLSAPAQRRLWRGVIVAWGVVLVGAWAALSAFTRVAETAGEEIGQTYVVVAPLAAEVMDLRARKGQMDGLPPLLAAEQVARAAGIGPERLRITLGGSNGNGAGGPGGSNRPGGTDAGTTISLHAQGLSLREMVEVLRDLRVQAGLGTLSANLAPAPGNDSRMDLDLVLSR